jgi:hypothetical protein
MNHLCGVDRLANRFSIMRHGKSKANARGIFLRSFERVDLKCALFSSIED